MRVIRNVYLYLVAMIGLIVFLFGVVGLADNILKNYVFQVDEYRYYTPYSESPCEQPKVLATEGSENVERTPEEVAECEQKMEEQNERNRRNDIGRQFSINIAQVLVGLPVWLFHWGVIQREYRRKREEKGKK